MLSSSTYCFGWLLFYWVFYASSYLFILRQRPLSDPHNKSIINAISTYNKASTLKKAPFILTGMRIPLKRKNTTNIRHFPLLSFYYRREISYVVERKKRKIRKKGMERKKNLFIALLCVGCCCTVQMKCGG